MDKIDVNSRLNDALIKRWGDKGGISIGGLTVDKFDTSKVQLKAFPIEYPDLAKSLTNTPTVLSTGDFANDSAATLTRVLAYNKEVVDTYEWTVSTGLTLTAGITAKAGLPILGEGEVSSTVELKVEGGTTTTHNQSVSFSETQTIEVPPYSHVYARAVLSVGQVKDVPFTARFRAYGLIGAHFLWDTNHWVWQWADLDAGGWVGAANMKVKKLPLDLVDRDFVVQGTFSASIGIKTSIILTPTDPDTQVNPRP